MALAAQDADDVVKCLFDVDAVLGRGFDKLTAELTGEGVSLLRRDLALRDPIALVADEHDGDGQLRGGGGYGRAGIRRGGGAGLLDSLDLVMETLDAGKRGAGRDAVDEDKALAVADPLVSQGSVFFLTGGVEHFEHARLAIDNDLLSVLVLNGGIVLLGKGKRHGQRNSSPLSGDAAAAVMTPARLPLVRGICGAGRGTMRPLPEQDRAVEQGAATGLGQQ